MLVDQQRMQAVGGEEAVVARTGVAQSGPGGCLDRRHDLPRDARGARAGHDGIAVRIEFRDVEVAVRVDERMHQRRGSMTSGALRLRKLASRSVPRPRRISSAKGTRSGMTRSSANNAAVSANRRG